MSEERELLKEGDVIELNETHSVTYKMPKHFTYYDHVGDWEVVEGDATLSQNHFAFLLGSYIVTHTSWGGSSGHRFSPNGHKVECVKSDNPRIKVYFFDSNGYQPNNSDVKVIGKAKANWSVDK